MRMGSHPDIARTRIESHRQYDFGNQFRATRAHHLGPENPVGFRMRQNLDVASGFVHGDGTAHASEGEGAHFVGNAGQDEVVFVLADPQAISGSV